MDAVSATVLLFIIPMAALIAAAGLFAVRAAQVSGSPVPIATTARIVAWIVLVFSALTGVFSTVGRLTNKVVDVALPVVPFEPKLPPEASIEGMTATLTGARFRVLGASIEGLSWPTRALLASGGLLTWAIPVTLSVLAIIACRQLLAGRPFSPIAARTTATAALVILIAGSLASVLTELGSSKASYESLQWGSAIFPRTDPDMTIRNFWPTPTFFVDIPLWPIGAALGLGVLAAIFKYGTQMQRDQEGLV